MKNFKLLAILFILAISVFSCDDDDVTPTGEVKLSLQANFGNEMINETSAYVYESYQLEFSKASTYLSDITLMQGTKEVKLADILYYDFYDDSDATSSSVVLSNTFEKIPQGTYTGIRFGVGVSPSQNNKKPTDYPATNPLSYGSEYWPSWESFIFTKIEGFAKISSPTPTSEPVIYHFGSNPVYRIITINKEFQVQEGQTALDMVFDLQKLLTINGTPYDVKGNPRTSHTAVDISIAEKLVDNYGNAYRFKN